ncbi:PAS domain S-box protein [Mucilaginibacter sp. RS28]|uniref:PAS domain S-box protein n=1 Tax=Mucilaginibacter straminoryzae TaxID=2932774 RepID=A0A9X2BC70_9SPHI|nr:PAS domain S-box protein [Mucilaginibacter straminoryzae]MCJ8208983.1 PAS domain S-box protein [Mucilaginibacter straminoryzae]
MKAYGPFHFDLEHFFELTPDLMCVAGFDGFFKKINPAVSKTLGYTDAELYSRPINSFVHPEDQPVTAEKRKLIAEGIPLLNFENRYITKQGEIVWLTWTSVSVKKDQVVFAIAKDITAKKKLEEYRRLMHILGYLPEPKAYRTILKENIPTDQELASILEDEAAGHIYLSQESERWLGQFESLVRKHISDGEAMISRLALELGMSERQLHRRVKSILNVTPNKFIRVIRLQVAREAIASGKMRSITEIARRAGFSTPSYFRKLFKEGFSGRAEQWLGDNW